MGPNLTIPQLINSLHLSKLSNIFVQIAKYICPHYNISLSKLQDVSPSPLQLVNSFASTRLISIHPREERERYNFNSLQACWKLEHYASIFVSPFLCNLLQNFYVWNWTLILPHWWLVFAIRFHSQLAFASLSCSSPDCISIGNGRE